MIITWVRNWGFQKESDAGVVTTVFHYKRGFHVDKDLKKIKIVFFREMFFIKDFYERKGKGI